MHELIWSDWEDPPTREAKKMALEEPSKWAELNHLVVRHNQSWQVEWERKREIGDTDFASAGAISSNTMTSMKPTLYINISYLYFSPYLSSWLLLDVLHQQLSPPFSKGSLFCRY